MADKTKLIGWLAIAIAFIGILGALRDAGAMLFVGFGDSSPMLRTYGVILVILPFILALFLFAFGLAALCSKPNTRMLALPYAYGQFIIAILKALGAFYLLSDCGLLLKIIGMLWSPISLPLIYAIVLVVLYARNSSGSQPLGAAFVPQNTPPLER